MKFNNCSVILFCLIPLGNRYADVQAYPRPRTAEVTSAPDHQLKITEEEFGISSHRFKDLLFTEIHNVIVDHHVSNDDKRGHRRMLDYNESTWNSIVSHGWNVSSKLSEERRNSDFLDSNGSSHRTLEQSRRNNTMTFPYLVCSHSSTKKSAYRRIQLLLKRTQPLGDVAIIRNDPDMSCFHVSMEHDVASSLREDPIENSVHHDNGIGRNTDWYSIIPMVDLMKVQVDTFETISDYNWIVPPSSSSDSTTSDQGEDNNWERRISIAFSAGHRKHSTEASAQETANTIINDIKSSGQRGARRRRRLQLQESSDHDYEDGAPSLSEIFSMTSSYHEDFGEEKLRRIKDNHPERKLLRQRNKGKDIQDNLNLWTRALKLGLEADHGCESMFENLSIRIHYGYEGFDIVLNPKNCSTIKHNNGIEYNSQGSNQCKYGTECSASNKHCIISLVMGLSTHPMVMAIESGDGAVVSDDYESQWITQTKVEGSRPLGNIGIDGENQIISVVDSGLDINHKYFGPVHPRVYEVSFYLLCM